MYLSSPPVMTSIFAQDLSFNDWFFIANFSSHLVNIKPFSTHCPDYVFPPYACSINFGYENLIATLAEASVSIRACSIDLIDH
jgi:hypothetical protein